MSEEKEESKREVNKQLVDTFCRKYEPATLASCDKELTMYDIRMFFNLFYVSDPRQDILDDYLGCLWHSGFQTVVSYSGEPVICVKIKTEK